MKELTTKPDGLRAALTAKKYVPLQREETKDGVKESRQLVLKGDFHIFVDGQQQPVRLPCKLEFKDTPSTVQLVQTALNIVDTGEQCLLVIFSNRNQRLDKYLAKLESDKTAQELKFAPPKSDETDLDEEE